MAPPSLKQPVIAVYFATFSGHLPILPKKNENLILPVNIG
jgi:hypothetical protein